MKTTLCNYPSPTVSFDVLKHKHTVVELSPQVNKQCSKEWGWDKVEITQLKWDEVKAACEKILADRFTHKKNLIIKKLHRVVCVVAG